MIDEVPSTDTKRRHRCWWRPVAFTTGLVVIFGLLYAAGYSRYESPQVKADREALARMATGNGVVFGSSHGFNILPEKAGLDGVNLAHGGQDVFEMVYMARAVKRAAPNLETVLFTISYFTFSLDNAIVKPGGAQPRLGRRLVMYAAFPSFDFVPGDASAWVKGLLSPVVTRDHWKSILWWDGSRPAFPSASDLPPNPKRDRRVANASFIVTHATNRCKSYAKAMRNAEAFHSGLHEDAFETLRDVSQDLEDAGVRVVLVTPPYFETYNACFDAKRQALARRLATRVAKETGAEYIDASKHPEFSTTLEYFSNSDHMNRTGKVAFSRWLEQRLAHTEKR
jgi:hypothetical protein